MKIKKEGEKVAEKYKCLSFQDRKSIEKWYLAGDRPADIAARLGVHTATIYHALQRGNAEELDINKRPAYCAELAQKALQANFRRRGR